MEKPPAFCRLQSPSHDVDLRGVTRYEAGLREDGVPLWEKKFCSEVGMVPWWKVVSSKTFMCSNGNILDWDDSAAKNAFYEAKGRYWAEINNSPCDICKPNPDLYIDEIDWNATINSELLMDLEQHATPEVEMDNKAKRSIKRLRYLMSTSERYQGRTENCGGRSHFRGNPQRRSISNEKFYAQNKRGYDQEKQGFNNWNNEVTQASVSSAWNSASGPSTRGYQSDNQWSQGKIITNESDSHNQGWLSVDCLKDDKRDKWPDGSWNNSWRQMDNYTHDGDLCRSAAKKLRTSGDDNQWSENLREEFDRWNDMETSVSCRWKSTKADETGWSSRGNRKHCFH